MRKHYDSLSLWLGRFPALISRLVLPVLALLLTALLLIVPGIASLGFDHVQNIVQGEDENLSVPALVLFGLVGIAYAVIGNVAYAHFVAFTNRLTPNVEEFFRNHDLAQLVGQSLGMVLRAAEEEGRRGLPDGWAMPGPDRDLLLRMARHVAKHWTDLLQQHPEAIRASLACLQDQNLLAFIRDPHAPALTDAQAGELLKLINPDNPPGKRLSPFFTDGRSETLLQQRLAQRFSEALREALKLDFAQGGKAYAGLVLDIAGELLKAGAAGVARTADNEQAVQEARQSLRSALPKTESAALRQRMESLAQQLDATYHAVKAEGHASARRDWLTHRGLLGLAGLLLVLGLAFWLGYTTLRQGNQAIDERLARFEAEVKQALGPRPLGEDPSQKKLPPELLEKAKLLLERGDKEQQALAKIALSEHEAADRLIQELKKDPLAEAFRLLTLEGTNWYNAGEFDKAIQPFEQALALQPNNTDARNWLAIAHNQARLGDIAAHQRRAIDLLTGNLALLPDHSSDWAMTQNNLGDALRKMPTGERAETLVKAIAAYTAALEVYTRQAHPVEWAAAQNNLGVAWKNMPTGERAENLGKAIAAYTASLEVRTRQAHPVEWAMTQNNLGLAWTDMPTGERAENLVKAIAAYTAALEVKTRQAHPVDWAATQNNSGNAWAEMPTGERAENLVKAIAAYTAALEVYTRQAHPVEWAATQNNLGNAWAQMPTAERAESLGKAIAAYTAALEVRTRQAHPVDWAATQNNLGIAWLYMPTGDRAENLGKAIAAYTAALEVRTRQAHPVAWAMTHFNLGLAFGGSAELGGGCADWRKAIAEVKAAAEVWTQAAFPYYHQKQIAPTLDALRKAWQAQGCAGGFEDIPPSP